MHAIPYQARIQEVSWYMPLILVITGIILALPLAARAETAVTWAQYDDPATNVYFSPDGPRIVRLSTGGINVNPNLDTARSSSWVSWVDKSRPNANRLEFARLAADGSLLEKGALPSIHGRIYSPAIALDSEERRAWLVWAENNGRREVLYASFRNLGKNSSAEWQTPRQVTADDAYSSNLPIIDSAGYDRIKISWLRTSPDSCEAASGEVMASDWTPKALSMQQEGSAEARTSRPVGVRSMQTRKLRGYGRFIRRPAQTDGASEEMQTWERLVGNKKVLTGAVHSGSGIPERLVKGRQ